MTAFFISDSDGDDNNSGQTEALAWETIGKHNGETFSFGDTISFKRGDTWELTGEGNISLIPPSDGSSGSPIVYGAYGTGADPIITAGVDRLGVTGDWTDIGSNRWTKTQGTAPVMVIFITGSTRTQGILETSQANVTAVNEWFISGSTWTVFHTSNPADASTGFNELITVKATHPDRVITITGRDWLEFEDLDIRYCNNRMVVLRSSTNIKFTDVEVSHSLDCGYNLRDSTTNNTTWIRGHIHDIGTFNNNGNQDNSGIGIDVQLDTHTQVVTDTEFSKISNACMTTEEPAGTPGFTISGVNCHGYRGSFLNAKNGVHSIADSTGDGNGDAGHIMATGGNATQGAGPNIRGLSSKTGTLTITDSVFKNMSKCLLVGGAGAHAQATCNSSRNLYMDTNFKSTGRVISVEPQASGLCSLFSDADIIFQSQDSAEMSDAFGIVQINGGVDISLKNATIVDRRSSGDVAFRNESNLTGTLTFKNVSITSTAGILPPSILGTNR